MKILEVINRGGFGRVEKVVLDNGTTAARKVFDPTSQVVAQTNVEKLKKRFKREARIQSSLSKDFFVPILSFDLQANEPWFTMPLCAKNYAVQIEEEKANGNVSRQPLADILNALEELHSLGFRHRDLKPQNILLHDGRWKLSDFGLVLPTIGETTQITSKDSVWGTQMYCSPEQAQDFSNVSALSDIYSFGCILHDVFSDKPRIPFHKHTADGQIGLIIEKCTETNPQKRFKSVAAVRGSLLSAMSETVAKPSPEATEWVEELASIERWETEQIRKFRRYVQDADTHDLRPIFEAFDEEGFKSLAKLDIDEWEVVALAYCDWAFASGFNFEYCDVVISRLECIFEIGSLDCKAAAAISAAELGVSHNRWYVMRRLFAMCGNALDDNVAKRIVIEIQVAEIENRFIASANGVSYPLTDFHPLIAQVLDS